MLRRLKYEAGQIYRSELNIIFFIVFLALSLFFVLSGILDYRNFDKEKEPFLKYEASKVRQFNNYEQYGGYGFRLLYEPSPLSLFFYNSSIFENLYSNVDNSERIKIDNSYKGKNLFQRKGLFKDFAGVFFLFGSLFMLYMGAASFKGKKLFPGFSNILIRLGILDASFAIVMAILYAVTQLFGLHFTKSESLHYLNFCLFLTVFLSFFFAAGLLLRVLSRNGILLYVYVFIFWFLSVSVIPEMMTLHILNKSQRLPVNEKQNYEKLKALMYFEKIAEQAVSGIKDKNEVLRIYKERANTFFNTNYRKNQDLENQLNKNVEKVVNNYGNISLFFPTGYYHFLSGELSGKGYYGYLQFSRYILNLRLKFFKFYLEKRAESQKGDMESFIKGNENIFRAKSITPSNFLGGLGITGLYFLLMLISAFLILHKKFKPQTKEDLKIDVSQLKPGKIYFFHCATEEKKEEVLNHLAREGAVVVQKLDLFRYDPGTSMRFWLQYECRIRGIDWDNVIERLEALEVSEFELNKKVKDIGPEAFNKAYLVLKTSEKADLLVFDDFIKGETRRLEQQFRRYLEACSEEKKIIYLSREMYMSSSYVDDEFVGDQGFEIYQIDVSRVSLR